MTTNSVATSTALVPVQSRQDLPTDIMPEIAFTVFEPYTTALINKEWLAVTNACYNRFASLIQTDAGYKYLWNWNKEIFGQEGNRAGVRCILQHESDLFFRLCDSILYPSLYNSRHILPVDDLIKTISFLINRTTIKKFELYGILKTCLEKEYPTAVSALSEELALAISSSGRFNATEYVKYVHACKKARSTIFIQQQN